jgi:calpain-15
VFRGEPRPSDARQGALGDCWLVSAIGVLAERPSLLRALFPAGWVQSSCGAYAVRLCLDGRWRVLVVDDLLPCTARGVLSFSSAARHQLYVPLLEKALAKAAGSYEAVEAGTCEEGLTMLTGAPVEQLRLQAGGEAGEAVDTDTLWARLLSCREAGFLAAASCGSRSAAAEAASASLGLQTQHAYSVLDVVQTVQGGHRLLRLRNPWGRASWRGRWAANGPEWTAELREEIQQLRTAEEATRRREAAVQSGAGGGQTAGEGEGEGEGGGIFWMGWDDFVAHFQSVDVCRVRRSDAGWMEARMGARLPASAAAGVRWATFSLELMAEVTSLDLVLTQRGGRACERAEPSAAGNVAKLADLRLVVFRANADGSLARLEAWSKRRVAPSVGCEAMLSAGRYVLVPLALNQLCEWGDGLELVLAVFASRPVVLVATESDATVARRALVALAMRLGKATTPFAGQPMVLYNLSDGAGSILYAENASRAQQLTVEVDARESFNLVSSRGALALADSIGPGEAQLLLALTQLEGSAGYSSVFQFRFRADSSRGRHEPAVPAVGGLHSVAPISAMRGPLVDEGS